MNKYLEIINTLIIPALGQTLFMTFFSTLFASILGFPIGILLLISSENHIKPMPKVNAVVDYIVNMMRSIPFIIMIIMLFPVARLIVGTSLGARAAVVSLSIAAAPFVARVVQSSLSEVPWGMIEAAKSMGATDFQIIFRVLIPEAMPSLISSLALTIINVIGYTAMAGAVGSGGLGDVAIRYGHQRFQDDVLYITVIVLILLVQIVQSIGNKLVKITDKR